MKFFYSSSLYDAVMQVREAKLTLETIWCDPVTNIWWAIGIEDEV